LYGATLKSPVQFYSDDHLFYAVLSDNTLNIYRTDSTSHDSLLQ